MTTDFVTGTPPAENFEPFDHLKNEVPLDAGVTPSGAPMSAIEKAWHETKVKMFQGKLHSADAQDPDTLNHLDWYESTGFTRPYPGESAVRWPTEFKNRFAHQKADLDD